MEQLRRKAEESESEWYQSLFQEGNDAIIVHDTTDINNRVPLLEVNESACTLTGYSRQELLALSRLDIFYWEGTAGQTMLGLKGLILQTGRARGECTLVHRDGHLIPVEVSGRLFKYKGNETAMWIFHDISARKEAENVMKATLAEKERLLKEIQEAYEKIDTLSGLIPICANCKKIRDDKGYWETVEHYISQHSKAEFTHGICPVCMKKLYPEFDIG